MKFQGREAAQIENEHLRVTVVAAGGHLAEILHKKSGINPLWQPPWEGMDPAAFDPSRHTQYGKGPESKLLAGILGHNLCLDIFGPTSVEEAKAGLTDHGEGSVAAYTLTASAAEIHAVSQFPLAGLRFERTIRLVEHSPSVRVSETVENLLSFDRPIAWTQHVTLGPPFLENGVTQFRHNGARSQVFGPPDFGQSDLLAGAEFTWPNAPQRDGGSVDLSTFPANSPAARFTTHLMDPDSDQAFFTASHPKLGFSIGYRWQRSDFPWLGIWEESRSRPNAPWNGQTVACGLEFGVSPFPETRRATVDRGRLFGVPTYRWLPAHGSLHVEYSIAEEFEG